MCTHLDGAAFPIIFWLDSQILPPVSNEIDPHDTNSRYSPYFHHDIPRCRRDSYSVAKKSPPHAPAHALEAQEGESDQEEYDFYSQRQQAAQKDIARL
jgi:hypothetical protein